MEKKTRKVLLTIEYVSGITESITCPTRAAAERHIEGYMADGVFPFIRAYTIVARNPEPVKVFCRDCGHNYNVQNPTAPATCGKCGGSEWVR